ncbi:MAG: hypothetical protein EOO30_05605 [Comamonadaceae bacterium]|nr:MAG: hypothetical protein EOO30_05605 [Comamonadaceae bacterium]
MHESPLTRRRHQAGDIVELDVARVEAEVAATEADALALGVGRGASLGTRDSSLAAGRAAGRSEGVLMS